MSLTRKIRVAAAAYPVERLPDMAALAGKLDRWVAEAASGGADLLVFPEYGGLETALLGAPCPIGTAELCDAAAEAAPAFTGLCAGLAEAHGVHILAGSLPTKAGDRLVNRATFHTPDGRSGWQDKQVMTPWEEQNTPLQPGDPLAAFETELGRIGVLICYDSEFPTLAEALAVDLLLTPSCTEALGGHSRVRLAARARALEGQCVTVLSQTVGPVAGCDMIDRNTGAAGLFGPPDTPFPPNGIIAAGLLNRPGWVLADMIDRNTGAAGLFGPPDTPFPPNGIIAAGLLNSPGWVLADIDPVAIAETRTRGGVATLRHRPHARMCAEVATSRPLTPNRP